MILSLLPVARILTRLETCFRRVPEVVCLRLVVPRGTIWGMRTNRSAEGAVQDQDYRALAEFRYHIRRYLDFSDQAAKREGIEPKQYQLLLAIKGLPEDVDPTVGRLAKQLHTRHHSTVELVNRAERNGFIERSRVGAFVFVRLTKQGERILGRVVQKRLEELRTAGPALVNALQRLIKNDQPSRKGRKT
jgi:DNA-binding MarR family transcriptional regulator